MSFYKFHLNFCFHYACLPAEFRLISPPNCILPELSRSDFTPEITVKLLMLILFQLMPDFYLAFNCIAVNSCQVKTWPRRGRICEWIFTVFDELSVAFVPLATLTNACWNCTQICLSTRLSYAEQQTCITYRWFSGVSCVQLRGLYKP